MKYCSECGAQLLTANAKFCSECGSAAVPGERRIPPISPSVQPAAPVSAAAQPRPASVSSAAPQRESRRPVKRIVVVLVVVIALFGAYLLGSRSKANETTPAAGVESSTDGQAAGQASDPANATTPGPAATSAGGQIAPSAAASDSSAMPSVVGMVLQDAQDLLQERGSYLMDQADATGQGRFQFLDSNWRVCSQEPAAGAPLSAAQVVTLSAVKLDEACPAG